MKNLIEEIEQYYKFSRLAKETLRKNSYRLNAFSTYLSNLMGVKIDEIFLDKVYVIKDSNGLIIRYLPIDSELLDDYFNLLKPKGFYPLRDHHSAISSFFGFLERNNNFNNPMLRIKFNLVEYYPEKKYSRILTRSEILKFLNSIINYSKDLETDLLLFTILLSTGCRISEVLNLTLENLDSQNDSFRLINTKNKKQRIVNLRQGMGLVLERYILKKKREKNEYIFLDTNNQKYTRFNVEMLLFDYLDKAGLPLINIHGFRHTFATIMAEEETPILVIQQLLGHTSIKSTNGYINPYYVRNKNIYIQENQQILESLRDKLKV